MLIYVSRLEPSGLYRVDGKRPDGITVVPWSCGKLLVWDATCPDMFAPSYLSSMASEAGAIAASAEERKIQSMPALIQPILLLQWQLRHQEFLVQRPCPSSKI